MSADLDVASWDREVLRTDLLTVVDFWAPWCPWCKRLMPIYDGLAPGYVGKVHFRKLNVDDVPSIAQRYGVMSLPTLKFFCSGREVGEIIGYLPQDALKARIDQVLKEHQTCLSSSSPVRR